MGKREYLSAQLDEQIKRFERESTKHKVMHRLFRYTIFGFTGISTVLASMTLTFPEWSTAMSLSIVIATAAIALVASVEGVRKPGELWIHERTTLYQLKDIKRALDFSLASPDDSTPIEPYFEQMQVVLGTASDKWQHQIVSWKAPAHPDVKPS